MRQQNLQNYIQWTKPYPPKMAPLPTVDFTPEPLPTLEIQYHWVTEYADMGYRVCTFKKWDGTIETFITNDKFFSIVEGVKERHNVHKINVYYDYEWGVMQDESILKS